MSDTKSPEASESRASRAGTKNPRLTEHLGERERLQEPRLSSRVGPGHDHRHPVAVGHQIAGHDVAPLARGAADSTNRAAHARALRRATSSVDELGQTHGEPALLGFVAKREPRQIKLHIANQLKELHQLLFDAIEDAVDEARQQLSLGKTVTA